LSYPLRFAPGPAGNKSDVKSSAVAKMGGMTFSFAGSMPQKSRIRTSGNLVKMRVLEAGCRGKITLAIGSQSIREFTPNGFRS